MKRLFVWCILTSAAPLIGQTNTAANTSASYMWGEKATSSVNGLATTQFWFRLPAIQGRSYCVEAGNFEGAYGDKSLDLELAVFGANGTTYIADNDDTREEPGGGINSRACWVQTLSSQNVLVRLSPHSSGGPTGAVTLRFVETTLFCPWFFVAGDYNAFSLLRNTSETALPGVVVTWRGLNGNFAGSTTVVLAGNGTAILNARDFVNSGVFSNGSVEIAHAGSPDQIQGSTTTLSGTTGLGFDAAFTQRKPW